MKDKLEIRSLRFSLKKALNELYSLEERNTTAISFIEKYSIRYNKEPAKIGLNVEEVKELLKLLKGEKDE